MIDWDALLHAPVMAAFGEGDPVEAPAGLVNYAPAAGAAFALAEAVFDDAFHQIIAFGDGTSAVVTTEPKLGVRLALMPAMPVQGDELTIPRLGKRYAVKTVEPDSHGWALLTLNVIDPSNQMNFADPDDSALEGN